MQEYNADFHLHGPHSIGVSKDMDLPHMVHGAKQKGLDLVATGDCLHPTWLKHLKENLDQDHGCLRYKDTCFILQTEVECEESVHHVILLPDYQAIDELVAAFKPFSKNIEHEWGGRPRVNLSPPAIVECVMSVGGLIGPAHAFTPFKSIFRQGKFDSLEDAYEEEAKHVHFLELGLSANSEYADRISGLHGLTFMSNSDAHSPTPQSLGREFNTLVSEGCNFDEVYLAIMRKDGRRFTRNVGMSPKLGKYNILFCHSCRRRIIIRRSENKLPIMDKIKITDDLILHPVNSKKEYKQYLKSVDAKRIKCPACQLEGKKSRIKLGVSERVALLADEPPGTHPEHRPPYINAIPLPEIIRVAMGIKSKSSKTLQKAYNACISTYGPEISILLTMDMEDMGKSHLQDQFSRYPQLFQKIAGIIESFRRDEIQFKPGGGGTYGELVFNT